MGFRIIDDDSAALNFLDEWNNSSDFVEAHTSGSTGTPKAIRLDKADMIRSATLTCNHFGIDSRSLLLSPLSADYVAGKMMIVRAIVADAEIVIQKPSNRVTLPNRTIDLLTVVASQLPYLIESGQLSHVRHLIVGGGAIPTSVENELCSCAVDAWATYGMTETCSHVALRHISAKEDFFTALDGVTFSIDDRNCLIINAPDFSFSPIVTNDIVDLIDNRQFRWLGRADNAIVTGGKKVFPEDIERKISAAIEIGDFYITSRPSAKWGEEIILVTDNYDIDDNTLLARLRTALVSHERPKAIVKTHIDKTSSGKIIRRKFQ